MRIGRAIYNASDIWLECARLRVRECGSAIFRTMRARARLRVAGLCQGKTALTFAQQCVEYLRILTLKKNCAPHQIVRDCV